MCRTCKPREGTARGAPCFLQRRLVPPPAGCDAIGPGLSKPSSKHRSTFFHPIPWIWRNPECIVCRNGRDRDAAAPRSTAASGSMRTCCATPRLRFAYAPRRWFSVTESSVDRGCGSSPMKTRAVCVDLTPVPRQNLMVYDNMHALRPSGVPWSMGAACSIRVFARDAGIGC
jgi:hypothetical protein